jgi:histone H3/H4
MAEIWKKCTECRTDIAFGATYYQCSVSTCNRTRMPLVFCSVICWDSHLSTVRHRDAGAIEAKAPTKAQWERELADDNQERPTAPSRPGPPPTPDSSRAADGSRSAVPQARVRADETRPNLVPPMPPADAQRRIVATPPAPTPPGEGTVELSDVTDKDILIVVSKLKKYIKDRSGFNTSDQVVDLLSDHVRAICDEAIRCAARNDRKTVLERDVPRPPRR